MSNGYTKIKDLAPSKTAIPGLMDTIGKQTKFLSRFLSTALGLQFEDEVISEIEVLVRQGEKALIDWAKYVKEHG